MDKISMNLKAVFVVLNIFLVHSYGLAAKNNEPAVKKNESAKKKDCSLVMTSKADSDQRFVAAFNEYPLLSSQSSKLFSAEEYKKVAVKVGRIAIQDPEVKKVLERVENLIRLKLSRQPGLTVIDVTGRGAMVEVEDAEYVERPRHAVNRFDGIQQDELSPTVAKSLKVMLTILAECTPGKVHKEIREYFSLFIMYRYDLLQKYAIDFGNKVLKVWLDSPDKDISDVWELTTPDAG